jgi:ASC-1-like (ASCH) protein
LNKNLSNSKVKVRNTSKEHTNNQGDTIVLNGDSVLKAPNINIRKYIMNTFNKTKIIARNSSGIF